MDLSTLRGRFGSAQGLFWLAVFLTVVMVLISTGWQLSLEIEIPAHVYVFGLLGAMVYVFTALAYQFGDEAPLYKILSRAAAGLPLAAGVFLLAFAFPVPIEETTLPPTYERVVAGLAFIAGLYVSMTLKAIGGVAERLLGVEQDQGEG